MKYAVLLLLISLPLLWAQNNRPGQPDDLKLPNGKSWNDAIAKSDHEKNIKDARELARLSAEIRDELEDGRSLVLSLKTLKKVEDAEKLAKELRGRMRRN
ncbi:MAG: hypothetical protein ABI811_05745 [Acidobacteriota bacterium]